jgi:membrane protease YdiL (CAAX protease family)
MAFRSKRLIAPANGAAPAAVTRTQIYQSTLASLLLLFAFSWFTGRSWGFQPFAAEALGAREWLIGAAALAIQAPLVWVNRLLRSADERRKMVLYRLLPRTKPEWALFVVMAIAAGIAEETAYRGVVFSSLGYAFGSPWAAALISAAAFAVAHSIQGWKSALFIFALALMMQALVWYTGTLVVAMAVHALFDIGAGAVGAWRIRTRQVDG